MNGHENVADSKALFIMELCSQNSHFRVWNVFMTVHFQLFISPSHFKIRGPSISSLFKPAYFIRMHNWAWPSDLLVRAIQFIPGGPSTFPNEKIPFTCYSHHKSFSGDLSFVTWPIMITNCLEWFRFWPIKSDFGVNLALFQSRHLIITR